jgi:hypothetical protein
MAKLLSTDFAILLNAMPNSGIMTIGNNTEARIVYRDNIMVPNRVEMTISLYKTDVVKMFPDESMAFSLGGFPTTTTKERVNQFLIGYNYKVITEKGTLYLVNLSSNTRESINDTEWYTIWRTAKVV